MELMIIRIGTNDFRFLIAKPIRLKLFKPDFGFIFLIDSSKDLPTFERCDLSQVGKSSTLIPINDVTRYKHLSSTTYLTT